MSLRKLDELIAEKVFNCKVDYENIDYCGCKCHDHIHSNYYNDGQTSFYPLKKYSTNLNDTKCLLDLLAPTTQIRLSNKAQGNKHWWVYICSENGKDYASQGDTISEAICLAALELFK